MPYSWKIEYTAPGEEAVDITALCDGFSITSRIDAFCREMSLDILDKDFYDELDFTEVPAEPQIEIFTKAALTWYSQGKFFIERPSLSAGITSDDVRGVWGRSITALLTEPFATKITKVWDSDTTFFAVCAELCTACGLTFDSAKSDIDDFTIFARTFEADNRYPADVLSEFCQLAGAVLSCDRTGDITIRAYDYSPASADGAVTDADIVSFAETPVYPAFGNRLKIMPTGSASGYQVELYVGDSCLSTRSAFRKPVFARVTDADVVAVNNIPVAWSTTFEGGVSGLARVEHAATNTQTVRFYREKKRADSFYKVTTEFPAKTILGIYAYRNVSRTHNFVSGGYTLSGNEVTLSKSLEYCDQMVTVDYEVEGVAVNYLINNGIGTLGQTATLTADVEGQKAEAEIYINNGCRCPVTLTIQAQPSSIHIGYTANILVYAEEAGGPIMDGRTVFLQQSSPVGYLKKLVLRLAPIAISSERQQAVNVISGVTQCEVDMFPSAIYGVYELDEEQTEDDSNPVRKEDNLYASHVGKIIELTQYLATGTELIIDYYAYGAAMTYFRGGRAGTARINAMMKGNTEEPVTAYCDVTVENPESTYDDDYTPPDWNPDNYEEPDWDDHSYFPDETFEPIDPGEEADIEKPCIQICMEQYPGGSEEREQCVDDCEEENNPDGKSDDGDGFDESDDDEGCEGAQCGEDQTCCAAELAGPRACRPASQCFGGSPDVPGATCEEQCQEELDANGTTSAYDEGSMRTIQDITINDWGYEDGSPGYWEKYEELKAAALAACLEECQECEGADPLATDAPETMSPDSDAYIVISGGKGSYTATLKSGGDNGFSMTGEGAEIVLSQDADGCGSAEIEVTDACGEVLTVGIRSTNGTWVSLPEYYGLAADVPCLIGGEVDTGIGELISGKHMQHETYSGGGGGFYDCGDINCGSLADCMAAPQACIAQTSWYVDEYERCSVSCVIFNCGSGQCCTAFHNSFFRQGSEWKCP